MAEYLIQDTTLTAIANAIREKTGEEGEIAVSEMAEKISDVKIIVEEKDINFYDFDGTLLYSYYMSDLPLAELPAQPDHSNHHVPLTGQGWNFTLSEVNALTGPMNIGAVYVPSDRKTHIRISILSNSTLTIPIYFYQSSSQAVHIDWGDGSVSMASATGNTYLSHTYAETGNYEITLHVNGTYTCSLGVSGTTTTTMFGAVANTNRATLSVVEEVYIGRNISNIYPYAFQCCYSLRIVTFPKTLKYFGEQCFRDCPKLVSVIIPKLDNGATVLPGNAFSYCYSLICLSVSHSITSIGTYAFHSCFSLPSVTLPSSVTTINTYAFSTCRSIKKISILGKTTIGNNAFVYMYSLQSLHLEKMGSSIGNYAFNEAVSLRDIKLSNNLTTIGTYAFQYNYSLTSVTIPSSVTNIGTYAFAYCYGVREYHIKRSSPPTLSSNAFAGIQSGCKIYVPSSSLSTYKSASVWSTYASYMVGE